MKKEKKSTKLKKKIKIYRVFISRKVHAAGMDDKSDLGRSPREGAAVQSQHASGTNMAEDEVLLGAKQCENHIPRVRAQNGHQMALVAAASTRWAIIQVFNKHAQIKSLEKMKIAKNLNERSHVSG